MLVWSTQFPILPNHDAADLLKLCRKWLVGSPHLGLVAEDVPDAVDGEIIKAARDQHVISVGLVSHDGDSYCGFRHGWQDEEGRDWSTEICGWHTGTVFLVGIHLHCQTANVGVPLPKPRKPYIVRQLLEEIGGDLDGSFQVGSAPRKLQESEIDVAVRLLSGEANHWLPVIYASATWSGEPTFDADKLAQWAAGMAHVVTEPSRRFSFLLRNRVDGANPYEGAAAICWPGGSGSPTRLFPFQYPTPVKFSSAIADIVRRALAGRRPVPNCTWDFVRELTVRARIDRLKREGRAGIDEYIQTFDEELRLTKARCEEAEQEISRLKNELVQRSFEKQVAAGGLLTASTEEDLYAGEQRDIVIRALDAARSRSQDDGRIREVLNALIESNPLTGEADRLEQAIRDALDGCTDLGNAERRSLEELGFTVDDGGKHLKLVFRGDSRYTFSMPRTGSDWRGMRNWISDVTKRLFK